MCTFFLNGCDCLAHCPIRHFYAISIRKVTFHCGNRCSCNGICYYREERVNTLCRGCPCGLCSRKGITRHRFLLPTLHVDRCNVVARRDAWLFVWKVASVSGRDRFIVPDGFIPKSGEHVRYAQSVIRFWSIVIVATSSHGWWTLYVTRCTRALRNDFVIGTNQGKANVIFVKKSIDLLRLQINCNVTNNQ